MVGAVAEDDGVVILTWSVTRNLSGQDAGHKITARFV